MLVHLLQKILNLFVSVSLLFGFLPYWNYANIDNSSFGWYILLIFLGDILGIFIHNIQIILFFCMSVSLLFCSLSYWTYINIEISPVLDEKAFWNFWRHSWDVGTLVPNKSNFCMSVSLLIGILPYWNTANAGISLVLDWIYFSIFLTFHGYLCTSSRYFGISWVSF